MADTFNLSELLDNEQTAALLGIKPNTLEIWRTKGRGPKFVKFGQTKQSPSGAQERQTPQFAVEPRKCLNLRALLHVRASRQANRKIIHEKRQDQARNQSHRSSEPIKL